MADNSKFGTYKKQSKTNHYYFLKINIKIKYIKWTATIK